MPIFIFGWVLYRPWTKNQLEHLEGVKNFGWHLSREMFLILKNYDKDQVQSDFQGPKAKKGQNRWVFIGSYITNQVEHQERLLSVELSSDLENLQGPAWRWLVKIIFGWPIRNVQICQPDMIVYDDGSCSISRLCLISVSMTIPSSTIDVVFEELSDLALFSFGLACSIGSIGGAFVAT